MPPTLADLARREAPRSIRNAATIGGTIALADPESELLAGLLAYGATVSIAGTTSQARLALDQVFDNLAALDDGLITDVSFPTTGHAAADRTGRTPADRPIVAAVAHRDPGGTRLALTGVASRPILVDADAIDDLEPPADFRGSSDYRRQLARILSARVVTSVEVAPESFNLHYNLAGAYWLRAYLEFERGEDPRAHEGAAGAHAAEVLTDEAEGEYERPHGRSHAADRREDEGGQTGEEGGEGAEQEGEDGRADQLPKHIQVKQPRQAACFHAEFKLNGDFHQTAENDEP